MEWRENIKVDISLFMLEVQRRIRAGLECSGKDLNELENIDSFGRSKYIRENI